MDIFKIHRVEEAIIENQAWLNRLMPYVGIGDLHNFYKAAKPLIPAAAREKKLKFTEEELRETIFDLYDTISASWGAL